jgi:hypothetical protein
MQTEYAHRLDEWARWDEVSQAAHGEVRAVVGT